MLPSPGFTQLLDSLSCSGGRRWDGEEFQELAGESQGHELKLPMHCKTEL